MDGPRSSRLCGSCYEQPCSNVPKAVVLCQVEKAKEDMLNQLYSSISAQSSAKIEELLREDGNVKQLRECCQTKQSSLLKLLRLLSIYDNRSSTAAIQLV